MAIAKPTTDRQVLALKPKAKPYETSVGGVRGLLVRTFPSGAKHWELRYVAVNGARRRMPLGEYPGVSLAEASDEARALRVSVVKGADPAGERQAERERARTGETLSELAGAYFSAAAMGLHGGRKRPKRPSSINVEKTRFRLHIEPKLGGRKFADLSRSEVKQFMRALASGGLSADSVASVGRTFSAIMGFAVHEDRLEANPVAGLTQPLGLTQRDRMFSEAALKQIWAVLDRPGRRKGESRVAKGEPGRIGANAEIAGALRFVLLTLQRREDVAGARWAEIDFKSKVWSIPAERHKSKRVHVVPLNDQALAVLREAAGLSATDELLTMASVEGFIFPSPIKKGSPVTARAMGRAVARICEDLHLPKGSPHDFRRNGATLLTGERAGQRRFIVSKVLGHTAHEGAAVTAVYDRNEYLAEKRTALAAWERLLLEIVGIREPVSNVLPFPGQAEASAG